MKKIITRGSRELCNLVAFAKRNHASYMDGLQRIAQNPEFDNRVRFIAVDIWFREAAKNKKKGGFI